MDIETIFALIDKAQASSFDRVEIQTQDLKLNLYRQSHAAESSQDPIGNNPECQAEPEAVNPEAQAAPRDIVHAPISGVFYRCKDPKAPPYVEVGSHVYKGQPLCIIEAMKTMNEICSPKTGVIEHIYPKNNEPITCGDALFAFAKEG